MAEAKPTTRFENVYAINDFTNTKWDFGAYGLVTTGDLAIGSIVATGNVSGVKGTFTGSVSGTDGTFTGKVTHKGKVGNTRTINGSTYSVVGSDDVIYYNGSDACVLTLGSTVFADGAEVKVVNDSQNGSVITLTPGIGSIGGNGTAKASTYSLASHTMGIITRVGGNLWVN